MKTEKAPTVAVATAGGGGGGCDESRFRKHPGVISGGGVCPYCLRDQLLRLCPCATALCASPSPSSSSTSPSVALCTQTATRARVNRRRNLIRGP
ncbi:unnamed protein product [Urochloa humidicola]